VLVTGQRASETNCTLKPSGYAGGDIASTATVHGKGKLEEERYRWFFVQKRKKERKCFLKCKISAFAVITNWVWNSVGTDKKTAESELLQLLANSQTLLKKTRSNVKDAEVNKSGTVLIRLTSV
jgi:hypothetical protein